MSRLLQTITSSLGKKTIMALSGLMLAGFLLVHAAGNSSIFWGRKAFIAYAEHLHALGLLIPVAETVLLAVFLIHVVTGLNLFFTNRQARTSRYSVAKSAGGSSWGSKTMPYTGIAILIFIVVHLFNFHFTDHSRTIADIVSSVLNNSLYAAFYCTAMLLLGLHISHGFWSLLQTLGINHPQYDRTLRTLTLSIGAIIITIFLAIVLLLIVVTGHLS